MPEKIAPNLSLSYGWTPRVGGTPGDSGWGNPVSNNFKKIDALLGLSVLSASATTPGVTTNGTRYIVAATGASGDFSGQANKVAVRVENTWEFYTPARGWLAEVAATGQIVRFDGSSWVDVLLPISADGANLLPDTYSWGTTTLPPLVASGQTVVAQAVTEALSGYGIKVTTGNTSNLYTMFAPVNGATGYNIAFEPGEYIISAYMSSTTPGHKVALALTDGVAKFSPDISLTTTRARYSFVASFTTATKMAMYVLTNRSGVAGAEVIIDSPMVSRRLATGSSSSTPPAFTPGPSAARVAAATQVSALNVNTPAATLANGATYTKIGLSNVVEDTRSGWSAANFTYTPAESGLYMVEAMLRPARSGGNAMAVDTNLQLGFGSSAADGVNLVADTSTDLLPFTLSFCKPMRLTAGTAYFMFGQHSQGTAIQFTYAELKIVKIAN